MEKMTLTEYLGLHGVSFIISDVTLDKCRFPHGLTRRQKESMLKLVQKTENEYQNKRMMIIKEYEQKVKDGEIINKTVAEQTLDTAMGHPENLSTQSARRMLVKRGIMTTEELAYATAIWDKGKEKVVCI